MKLTFLGTGTSVGVPTIGCKCKVCTSNDPHDKRLAMQVGGDQRQRGGQQRLVQPGQRQQRGQRDVDGGAGVAGGLGGRHEAAAVGQAARSVAAASPLDQCNVQNG